MNNNFTISLDEICQQHGGRNFIYQYVDENFERTESVCEFCSATQHHTPSQDIVDARASRSHERPQRPSRKSEEEEKTKTFYGKIKYVRDDGTPGSCICTMWQQEFSIQLLEETLEFYRHVTKLPDSCITHVSIEVA